MPKNTQKTVVVAYVPVIHRGYVQFFTANKDASEIWIIGEALQKTVDYLRKDLRRLKPEEAAASVASLFPKAKLNVLEGEEDLKALDTAEQHIVLPDEDISREVSKRLTKAKVTFYPVFLRWDRQNVDQPPDDTTPVKTSRNPKDIEFMKLAYAAAAQSADIWRRVGAVLVDGEKVLASSPNQAEPTVETPWIEGDPRNLANRGTGLETYLFTHAEALLIAEAAKTGTSLRGKTLYVTTFPCPVCAKQVAHSGIARLVYGDGYAVLDGYRTMTAYGVDIVHVEGINSSEDSNSKVPYIK